MREAGPGVAKMGDGSLGARQRIAPKQRLWLPDAKLSMSSSQALTQPARLAALGASQSLAVLGPRPLDIVMSPLTISPLRGSTLPD